MKPKVPYNSQKGIRIPETAAQEKARLISQIRSKKQMSEILVHKIQIRQKQYSKFTESNQRNMKRLIRYKQKYESLWSHRTQPEYFLYCCGFMNEYMQDFMLSHDQHMVNHTEQVNPDNMSYEQLLQLGQAIGKVSKGISKQQFQDLERHKNTNKKADDCPVCCTQFQFAQILVRLPCKHVYHEQCIMEWLKDENVCPMCKKSVLDA